MYIEKLIEQLKYYGTTYAIGDNLGKEIDGSDELMLNAATALSTLQAENEKLRNEVERQRRSADDRKHLYENAERAYMKVVAELEQVKRCIEIVEHQRDAAIYDMTALMAGQCCDLCAVEYCNDRGKTEMCTAFKWRGPEKED